MTRLSDAFAKAKAENRLAVMPYLMAGFPTRDATADLIRRAVAAGADLLELGVPFSDPIADGAVVRKAAHTALTGGASLAWTLDLVAKLRAEGITIPIVLMGYCNPFLAFGIDRLAAAAEGVIDGFIIPDLSAEDAAYWRPAFDRHHLGMVSFVAPTTPPDRLPTVLENCTAFLYAVAVKGVTGARTDISLDLAPMLARLRAATDLPVCVGFGISTPAHVASLKGQADGVIFASAMLDAMDKAPGGEGQVVTDFVTRMRAAA
jgi:tryptophan synthase alpha chain